MGYKHDQNIFPETYRPHPSPDQESRQESQPEQPSPPSPQLNTPSSTPYLQPPPSYTQSTSGYHSQPLNLSWASQDPRSSSTQSLVPAESGDGKRKLLLIYIHGFLGNDDSFHSFPAHVHNFVAHNLVETHIVHTKIYPRYKSRKSIELARDDFSDWLRPNESVNTDIILFGHSMGGLLSAEVVLLVSRQNQRHRIIGTINFDCPFLGLHPGVVVSGVGSLFRSDPELPPSQSKDGLGRSQALVSNDLLSPSLSTSPSTGISPVQTSVNSEVGVGQRTIMSRDSYSLTPENSQSRSSSSQDPNYNPPFPNDIRIPVRTGWDNALHFMTKHSNGLTRAAKSYVTSHLEFGKCIGDYKELMNRYAKLRALEDVDSRQSGHQIRVRFVNYYTASTGRPKKAKLAPRKSLEAQNTPQFKSGKSEPLGLEQLTLTPTTSTLGSTVVTPQILVEERQIGEKRLESSPNPNEHTTMAGGQALTVEEPTALIDKSVLPSGGETPSPPVIQNAISLNSEPIQHTNEHSLPPLPKLPDQPPQFDPADYSDKDLRNLAQKEYSRQTKNYVRAIKDHDKAIKDRQKLIDKKEKLARKEIEKRSKHDEKVNVQGNKGAKLKKVSSPAISLDLKPENNSVLDGKSDDAAIADGGTGKPKRDKKFCMLPPKTNNDPDPCWIRVYMKDVDEVGAHCGLFLVGDQYEWLVSDVGKRIQQWVSKE